MREQDVREDRLRQTSIGSVNPRHDELEYRHLLSREDLSSDYEYLFLETSNSIPYHQELMLATVRTKKATSTSLSLLLLGSALPRFATAYRSTHHKAAAAGATAAKNPNTTTTTTRNASYASGGGGSGWDSSVDNPFKMDRPLNVFGRPLAQCGTNPMTGFYRDGVSTLHSSSNAQSPRSVFLTHHLFLYVYYLFPSSAI